MIVVRPDWRWRGATRVERSAGATLQSRPVSSATTVVKISTRASSAGSSTISWRVSPIMPTSRCTVHRPSTRPAIAPSAAITRAFGEELANEPAAAGADGQPQRHLVVAGAGAREQQVRDVGAPDDEDEPDDRHHDEERRGELPADVVESARGGNERDPAEVAPQLGVRRVAQLAHVGLEQRVELSARLLHSGARRTGGRSR